MKTFNFFYRIYLTFQSLRYFYFKKKYDIIITQEYYK